MAAIRRLFARSALIATPSLPAAAPGAGPPIDVCGGLQIVVVGEPPPEWARAVENAVSRLRGRDDLDRCARLELEASSSAMFVHVLTSDGRVAVRRVVQRAELARTVQALVTLPAGAAPPAVSASTPESAADTLLDGAPVVERRASMHFELGLGASARIAAAPLYGGLGMQGFAQMELQQWLVAVTTRWDAVNDLLSSPSPSGFNMQTFAVGALVGHRLRMGTLNFDGLVGPTIVVENQEAEGPADGLGGTANDVRADVLVRLSGHAPGKVRFFASADVDVSLGRLRRSKQLDRGLPSLPSWSGGVQLGVLWGTL